LGGIGGGSQGITWQRYDGVRHSKFISADDEHITDIQTQGPVKPKKKDMWTEVTKDLVLREAIDGMGYRCEESEDFFYVMEYLRYVCHPFDATVLVTNNRTGGCSPPCRNFR